jgi:hypothetical protein
MSIYSSAAENYQSKGSKYDELEESPHVSDGDFHALYGENECASAILQGFATFMYREKTGEPHIPYAVMHKTLTPFELKVFLQAFGHDPKKLPDDIGDLWKRVLATFDPKKKAKE